MKQDALNAVNHYHLRVVAISVKIVDTVGVVKEGNMSSWESFENVEIIDIKYFRDVDPIEKYDKGDWIDLRSGVDIDLKAGESALIPLGVGMILPDGYEAHIVPRSSTLGRFGIIQGNHVGIIDNSYSGDEDEWVMSVIAIRDTHIHKNDRICQFRIVEKQPCIVFQEVDHLNEESRGGFGSTGTT